MRTTVFTTIENSIQVPFFEDKFEMGAVCFANDEEVRADFKLQFTIYDVVNYVYGVVFQLYSKENIETESILDLKIPYPKNAAHFWECSDIGKKIRQEQIIKEIEYQPVDELHWENV